MANTLGRLQVDLEARIAKFESDMGRAARILQRDMVRSAQASERAMRQMRQSAERDMERLRQSARTATTAVAAFFSIQQGARLVAGLGRVADQYSNIQAKVRLAAGENANLGASLQQVFGVAQRTFNSLDGTASLVQRGANALVNFGQSADQAFSNALQLAEIFNKALVVSGASSEEASAAAMQFSQALASGKFNGDEFRSVMENNSRFAQLLADSLGVTIAQLRDMSKEGKLTTTTFLNLIGKTGNLDAQFARMPLTIGRAKTQLDNAFTKYIGDADKASGVSRAVAGSMSALAQNIGPVVDGLGQLAIVAAGAFAGRGIQAIRNYTAAIIEQAQAERMAQAAAAERAFAQAASSAAALTRARAEQIDAESAVRAITLDRQRIESTIGLANAQAAVIRANALRATSEIELARLSQQLTAVEGARAAATAALGEARQREVAANAALASSNRTLAAAEIAAGVAGATAGARISLGARSAQVAVATLTGATRLLGGAISALGGPLGIAIAGVALWATKMAGASQEARALRQSALDAAEGLAALNKESSAESILAAGKAAIAEKAKLQDLIDEDQKKVDRAASFAFDPLGIKDRLASNKAALAELQRQMDRQATVARSYVSAQSSVASATGTVSEELTKEAERLKAQRIEVTEGIRARLEYEAVKAAGVQNASQLSQATKDTITQIVNETAAIDGAKQARTAAGKAARAEAAEAKRLAKEQAQAQKQFQADLERMASQMGGEFVKAHVDYEQSLRDIKAEYDRGGASAKQFAEAQALLKQQFDKTVAGIRAGVLGPLAEANFEYQESLRLLREDAQATGVSEADLAASEERLARAHAQRTKSIKEELDPVGTMLENMQRENELLGMTNAQREVEIELQRISVGLAPQQVAAARARATAILAEREAMQKQIDAMDEFRQNMVDNVAAVLDGSKSIKQAFEDMANAILQQISRMLAQRWVDALFGQQGTSQTGSIGGGFMSWLKSFFSGSSSSASSSSSAIYDYAFSTLGAFAGGTTYAPGGLAVVGEEGPEIVDLPRGSRVYPTGTGPSLGGGLTIHNHYGLPTDPRTRSQINADQARQQRRADRRNGVRA